MQYKGDLTVLGKRQNLLLYQHFMGGGYSGAPLILK
jgi:hypothetical protein